MCHPSLYNTHLTYLYAHLAPCNFNAHPSSADRVTCGYFGGCRSTSAGRVVLCGQSFRRRKSDSGH